MAQDNSNVGSRAFWKNLASGGVAIIPVVGPLLKAAIFDTFNEIDAKAEAAKVDTALASIQSDLQDQSADIAEVLDRLNTSAGFRDETKSLVDNLGAVMRDAEKAPVSEQLEQAVINFRLSLIEQLNRVSNASLDQLVTALPDGSSNVSNQAIKLVRVNQLVEWAESSTGPGLDQLVLAGRRLRLLPNFS